MRWILGRGLLGSLLLVLSGLLDSKIPHVGSAFHGPVVGALRRQPDRVRLGIAIGFVALVLLTWAWWSLARRVSGEPDGVRMARWAAAVWTVPLLLAPPLFSGDGWSYVATGYLAGHGLSPYAVTPAALPLSLSSGVAKIWLHTTSPYGPVTLVWGGLFSRFTANPWLLLYAHRLLAFAGLGMLAFGAPRLARRAGRDPARATALALASPLVVAHGIGGLHNDLLLAGLVVLALCVTTRDRWWWGALIAGVAAAVKVPGAGAAVGVVLLSLAPAASLAARLRRSIEVVLVSVISLVAVSFGSGLGLGWVGGLTRTADEQPKLLSTGLAGRWVARMLARAGPVGHALDHRLHPVTTAKDLGLLLLVVVLGVIALRRRVPDESAALTGAALAMLAATLLSPAMQFWYFLWCLPLLVCVRLPRRGERAVLAFLAALGLVAVADPALRQTWLTEVAVDLMVLAPMVAYLIGGQRPHGVAAPPQAQTDLRSA